MRVDKILEDSPLAVKQIFELESGTKEASMLSQSYDQHDLLWKKFGFEYDKIYPKYVKVLQKKFEDTADDQNLEEEDFLLTTKNTNPFAKTTTIILTEEDKNTERQIEVELKEMKDEDIRVTPLDE